MKRNPIQRLKIRRETLQILESSLRQAGGGRFAGAGSDDGSWTGCCCTTVTTDQ